MQLEWTCLPLVFLELWLHTCLITPIHRYIKLYKLQYCCHASEDKFSFINRLKVFVSYAVFWYGLTRLKKNDLWEKYGKANSRFASAAVARRVHGIALIPHDFVLEQSYPLGANVKVTGAMSPEPARRLPEYLDKYICK